MAQHNAQTFDMHSAVQHFWGIMGNVEYTDVYKQITFTRADMLEWRNHPLLLKISIQNKGVVYCGGRGAVEFRPTDPKHSGSLDVFCEHPLADISTELHVEQDYITLATADHVIADSQNFWPGLLVTYK